MRKLSLWTIGLCLTALSSLTFIGCDSVEQIQSPKPIEIGSDVCQYLWQQAFEREMKKVTVSPSYGLIFEPLIDFPSFEQCHYEITLEGHYRIWGHYSIGHFKTMFIYEITLPERPLFGPPTITPKKEKIYLAQPIWEDTV